MLKIEAITSLHGFSSVKDIWNRLLKKTDASPLFLSHEWFECCLNNYSVNKIPLILLIKEGTELLGIAPFWIYHDVIRKIRVRKLDFITSPDTPFVDFIVAPQVRREIISVVLAYLQDHKKKYWDLIYLSRWSMTSSNYLVLREILVEKRANFFTELSGLTPYISVKGDWETFLKTRSTKFNKTHRNIINRFKKLKNVEVQCIRDNVQGDFFEEILAVSRKSWKHKKGVAISGWKEATQFFSDLNTLAIQNKWLFVWLLRVDGSPVAMEYDLECDGKVYALRADYDDAFKKYSPGAYLEYTIIKHLFEDKYLEYCTGPGMNTYKLHWTEETYENRSVIICNSNLKGLVIWGLQSKMYPFLRKVRDRNYGQVKDFRQ